MKIRRFLSVLLTMVMILSMFASIPFAAQAAGNTVSVSDWDGLQNAIKKASSGQVIQLGADITCKKNGGDQIKVDKKTVTIDLNGHTLDRNRDKQDDDGHVIEVKNNSTLTIIDSVGGGKITGGYAKRGGGVNVSSNSTLIIESGTITGNQAKWGGGIYVHGKLTMNGGVVTKNTVTDEAGGIFCNDDSVVTLNKGVVVSENTAENGGGILNEGGTLTMTGVQILNNRTTKKGGGGVNVEDKATTTLTDCTVSGNTAQGNGGGIYINSDCTLTVNGGTISNNKSQLDGGGIYTRGKLTVKGKCTFERNESFDSGGAIRVKDSTTTVEGGTFTGNEAGDSGGAIYVNDSTLKLYGGNFTGNTATLNGGGILVGDDGTLKVHGAPVVKDNKAETRGDDIYLRGSRKIELDAALTSGAMLGADAEKVFDTINGDNEVRKKVNNASKDDIDYRFTKNLKKYHPNDLHAHEYFTTNASFTVLRSGDEAAIRPSNWKQLEALVGAVEDGGTVKLDRDYYSVKTDSALNIPNNKNLILDLNGHKLDRGLTKPTAGGAVIMNRGGLTIRDSAGGGVITGGYADDNAGGILNNSRLTLEGGTITGNHAVNNGGGIQNNWRLIINGGKISNNIADRDGGGINNWGALNMSGGEITGNSAGMSGGAIFIADYATTITGGTFTGNSAALNGGGIFAGGGTLNLYGGSVSGNKAAMEGGGILYGANATVSVKDAPVVDGNTALTGANVLMRAGTAIQVAGQLADGAKLDLLAQDATKVLTKGLTSSGSDLSAFTYNQEQGVAPALKDGELFVDLSVKADVWVSDWDGLQKAFKNAKNGQVIGLSKNISAGKSSRIKLEGGKSVTLELNGHSMDRGLTSQDDDGHVIEVKGKSTLTIIDSVGTGVIKGGYAKRGGGINIEKGSTCVLKGGAITGNKAKLGGGVYAHGTFRMEGGSIAGNEATCIEAALLKGGMIVKSVATGSGGGIYCGEEGALDLTGGTVSGNTSDDAGGIYNGGSKNVTIKGVKIIGNTSRAGGGGVNNNDGGKATLEDCEIRSNHANGNGGGIWNQDDSTLTLKNCVIESNTADEQGGAIFTKGALTVTGGAIKNNTAKGNGGGIRLWNDTTTINSGAITGNTAQDGNGGGIFVGGATLNLYGGEITGNTASGEGGGIEVQDTKDAKINVHGNPVVKDNTADTGDNVYLYEGQSLTVNGAMQDGASVNVSVQGLYYGGRSILTDGHIAYTDEGGHSGIITAGFNARNKGEDPAKYFSADEGCSVRANDKGEALVIASDWSELQRQIDAAADGATLKLDRNWGSVDADYPLTIPRGKTLTIDLNGHTLHRGLTSGIKNGCVISNSGTLTIMDATGRGKITGGFSKDNAGGIWNDGTLTLEGGTITGNRANTNGGGIYNTAKGALTVNGGTISSNTASNDGAGIYTEGTLTITGGTFKGNTASLSGGAVEIYGGTATITGGSFTGNTATKWHGGGIYVANGTLNLYGGSVTGNRAGMEGGGLLYGAKATVNVQDAPVVRDNTAPTGANILLRAGNVIRLTGPLAESAKLDVTAQDTENVLTKGLAENGSLDNFTYNNNIGAKPGLKDGEMAINLTVEADVWVSDWNGLQKAVRDAKDGQVIALGKNIAANGAGRIKVDGKTITIDLNGYAMDRGRTSQGDDGHVIEVTGKATLTIRDTRGTGVIKGGYAKRGGGINIGENATCILEGGTIAGNKAKWGGGVYAHGTFKMTGGEISANEATDEAGGIYVNGHDKGKLELTGGTIVGNSAKDCGGVFNDGSKSVTLKNVRIVENIATEQGGGGFNNNDGGSATLTDCVIRGNRAAGNGGGLWNQKDASLTLNNCTIEGNTANEYGGGVYTKGKLTLSGGSLTGNTVTSMGGGIYVTGDKSAAVDISGALAVQGNSAGRANDVYLIADKALTVAGAMADGARVGVQLEKDLGVFAAKFAANNPDEEPGKYFFSEDGFAMEVVNGDAVMEEEEPDPVESDVFLPRSARVVSYENVNSRNWMSGVSGERRLNEINIPGTHDAAMNVPKSAESLFEDSGSIFGGAEDAKTQWRYIDEQMNDGFRYFDLRLNNKYQKRHNSFYEFFTIDYRDDGRNLWLVHGCNAKGGTYYAQDHDGNDTSFDEVLEWAKDFLRKHPTETIILSLRPETQWEDQWDTIWLRAKKILKQFSTEINPSTGKPYLYMEDGVFGKAYTYYPKLKDVRGQVFIRVNKDRDPNNKATMGGLTSFGAGGVKYRRPEGGFEEPPAVIISHINSFYSKYGNVAMPRDALTHLDLLYYVPTNIVEKTKYPIAGNIPIKTPVESAEVVNATLFAPGGVFDRTGFYLGWVCMIDGALPEHAARIWRTNFYDMDYVTVTVKSGLSAADLASGQYTEAEGTTDGLSEQDETSAAQASGQIDEDAEQPEAEEGTQTYLLLKGTEITVPECIYEYDPAETGRDFQSWNATGETVNQTYRPGDTFVVMEDTTFTGQWLAEGETSVDVVWQDMDDEDGLRTDSIELEVYPDEDPEHMYTQTVTAADGWRTVLAGDVQKIVPVWERIGEGEQGADDADSYRFEVSDAADAAASDEEEEVSLMGSGLILTLIHTPGAAVSASGAITWDDYDDRDGLRPESVTLHLYKGEEELDSQTVTAENEWQYDFGELPMYENGQKVAYLLTEDEIEGYNTSTEDMAITNAHTPKVVSVSGAVFWDDARNESGQRPESVTVRLLANGEEVASLEVTPEGASATLLEVPADYEEGASEKTAPTEEDDEYGEEEDETEAEATEPAEAPAEEANEEEAADDSAYVDRGDDAEAASAESGETAETVEQTEQTEEAGWSFSFYGVPVYDGGKEVVYTIVEDEIEKYDYTINTAEEIWITNILLPDMVMVAFDANGGAGEMETIQVVPQSEFELPECGFTSPEGMEFAGWTLTVEAPQTTSAEAEPEAETEAEAQAEAEPEAEPETETIYNVGDVISVTGNATLTAQWQPIPQPVEITFDANGGEGEMDAAQPDENNEYILPESGFTAPEGMEFAGWTVAVEAQPIEAGEAEEALANEDAKAEAPSVDPERVYEPGDTITVTASATATAQWQEPAQPITIAFDANGGEGEMEAAQTDESGEYILPECGFTAPEGTQFEGWLISTAALEAEDEEVTEETTEETTDAGHTRNPGDVIVVSGDTTAVAQWQIIEEETDETGEEISVTVTLKVVNGTWSDGTKEDKTIVLTGHEGDMFGLKQTDLPGVGFDPDEGYYMGAWDVEPTVIQDETGEVMGDPITEDTTYTYTYSSEGTETFLVTFKVVNGAFDDGETDDHIAFVDEGETLAEGDIPAVGQTPDEGYEEGAWDVEPSPDVAITEDTTYTYTYAEVSTEETPAEGTEETPVEGTEEQPTEEQPAEGTEETPTEGTEEQPAETEPKTEQGVEEQPAETEPEIEYGTEEAPADEAGDELTPDVPADAEMCTITFDGGGADGEMEAVQAAKGSEYTLPECEYTIDGCVFDTWLVTDADGMETAAYKAGDTVTVEGDMTAMASWLIDEGGEAVEAGSEEAEGGSETDETENADTDDSGLTEEVDELTEAEPEEEPVEEPAEEQPGSESAETEPEIEQGTEEQPAGQPPEKPAEEKPAEKSVEAPADAEMCTITFDGGGADGEMAAVQAAKGSQYTLPECEYYIDGCVFDAWLVSGADGAEAVAYKAGDSVTVNGDMTAMAGWLFDEGGQTVEAGSEEVEGGSETGDTENTENTESGDESGLDVETEDVPEETIETEQPSEVGSVFSGAGIAAIVAAVVLVLAAAGVAIAKKKKK